MYRNVTEDLVEDKVEELWKNHTACTCERRRENVIVLSLNNLPPQYILSNSGVLL